MTNNHPVRAPLAGAQNIPNPVRASLADAQNTPHPVGAPLAGAQNKTTATANVGADQRVRPDTAPAETDMHARPQTKKTEQKDAEKLPKRNFEELGV